MAELEGILETESCPTGGIVSLFELEVTVPDKPEETEEHVPVNAPEQALTEEARKSLSSFSNNIKIVFPAKFVQNEESNFQEDSMKLVRRIFRDCLKFEMKKAVETESKVENTENIGCDNEKEMLDIEMKRSISPSCDDTSDPKKRLKSNDDPITIDDLEKEEDGKINDADEPQNIVKSNVDAITKDGSQNEVKRLENEDTNDSKEGGEMSSSEDEEPSNTTKLLMGLNYQESPSSKNNYDESSPSNKNNHDKSSPSNKNTCDESSKNTSYDEWTVWNPVWMRRKNMTKIIKAQMSRNGLPLTDIIKIESHVSEEIIKDLGERFPEPLPEPNVVFQAHPIFNKICEDPPVYQRCLWLGLEVVDSRRQGGTMIPWLTSYLPNIVTEIIDFGGT